MIRFQFGDGQDYFDIDPVDYAVALGERGLARYSAELAKIAATVPPEKTEVEKKAAMDARFTNPDASLGRLHDYDHVRFTLNYNAQRLAVIDRNVAKIVELYAGDQTRSYRLHNTAKALVEIGEIDQAIEWAERATFLEVHRQAETAGGYWCELLHEYRGAEEPAARTVVFERWPSSRNASRLHAVAGESWVEIEVGVLDRLEQRPYDYIVFLLLTLKDVPRAWVEAHRFDLDSVDLWTRLVDAYQQHDPAAVIPVLERLIASDLEVADAGNYQSAVKRLKQLRMVAAVTGRTAEVDALISDIRVRHRNRPRLMKELDRGRL